MRRPASPRDRRDERHGRGGRRPSAGSRATVVTTARSLPSDHPDPANFIAADTATVAGTQTVVDQLQGEAAVDAIVHMVGGSSAPTGGFSTLTGPDWEAELQ